MKIYFDARMIDHPGIGRYIKCLLPLLAEDKELDLHILGQRERIKKALGMVNNIIDFNAPIYSIREQVGFLRLKKIIGNDILHVPHYNIPVLKKFNLVVTLHDIIHILYPTGAKNKAASIYMKYMVKKALSSAEQVICVSNSTKESIEKLFGIQGGNLTVIYEGIDKVFSRITDQEYLDSIREKYKLPERFILYVGSIRRHKNITGLLAAFEQFTKRVPDIWLVIAGRYSQPINLKRPRVLYLGEVASDADLAGIYNQACCLFNLSSYEGFGLTILEAQACGVPVICSDIAPHMEIGGDGIAAVEPSYIDQIYENLYNVLFEQDIRSRLISRGTENAARFNWQSTAKKTIEVYKRLYNESSHNSRLAFGDAGRGKDT
ncbi:MAG: glycosyltransferase family 1 protein [Candidatus Omnitrophota bacterium]|jgi:glycosyltransferase involved in cell wall biosynthesis